MKVAFPFKFSSVIPDGSRRFNPPRYIDYTSYKPWLRDEYGFRCVYCLRREVWDWSGDRRFSVEHLVPKRGPNGDPSLECVYTNLIYACVDCNSSRSDTPLPLDIKRDFIGNHLVLDVKSGEYREKSSVGIALRKIFALNASGYPQHRRRVVESWARVCGYRPGVTASDNDLFRFPQNLPDLRAKAVKSGMKACLVGIDNSARERSLSGALEEFIRYP